MRLTHYEENLNTYIMKAKVVLSLLSLVYCLSMWAYSPIVMNEPDSAYVFAYATEKNDGRNGLHFAWSRDGIDWSPIGPEHSYVRSDYAQWGIQKRMLQPFLFPGKDGLWHCVWTLNENEGTIAHTTSTDLAFWWRQSYPVMSETGNCLELEVSGGTGNSPFILSWISTKEGSEKAYRTTTTDFRTFSPVEVMPLAERKHLRQEVLISGKQEKGMIYKVSWGLVDGLIKSYQLASYKASQNSEVAKDDLVRFAGLESLEATITIDPSAPKEISDLLIGIFFEDINYAADGGLYAELVQNRDFEYDPSERGGNDPKWNHQTAWQLQ